MLKSFEKFSELSKKSKGEAEKESSLQILPQGEPPHVPNLPTEKPKKVQQVQNTDDMKPEKGELIDNPLSETNVEFIGKIAKLPKGVKASNAYNFLENVKVSKSSIWYLMIEKQNNELQMVKYNYKKGVDLNVFIKELKSYYIEKSKGNATVVKLIENIQIDGNDKYSWIKNVPMIEFEGRKMISKITEDLIRLLSK